MSCVMLSMRASHGCKAAMPAPAQRLQTKRLPPSNCAPFSPMCPAGALRARLWCCARRASPAGAQRARRPALMDGGGRHDCGPGSPAHPRLLLAVGPPHQSAARQGAAHGGCRLQEARGGGIGWAPACRRRCSAPPSCREWEAECLVDSVGGCGQDCCAAVRSFPLAVSTSTTCCRRLPLQVQAIPPDRLLLESDSPDGQLSLPAPWLDALPSLAHLPAELDAADLRRVNRPCVLRWTLRLVAAAAGRPEAEVAQTTWENACRVFGCKPGIVSSRHDGTCLHSCN